MSKVSTLLFDFSRVLLHTKDSSYAGKLNDLYRSERSKPTFQFFELFTMDGELLNWLGMQKDRVKLALYTSEMIQKDPSILPKLTEVFGGNIFSGAELGLSKASSQDYIVLCSKLGVEPKTVIFVDGTMGNIRAALDAGLQAIQFFSREQIITELSKRIEE